MNLRQRATHLLMRVVPDHRQQHTDPVGYWDRYTSGCDARTALCLACGVPVESIHAARGTGPVAEFQGGAA